MSKEQMIATIVVAIIGAIGASIGGGFAFAQFLIKRKDEKEEKSLQEQIDDAIEAKMEEFIKKCGEIGDKEILRAKEEMQKEMEKGLLKRSEEGKKRFDINSEQIQKNTEQIAELTELVKTQVTKIDMFAESMTALNKVVAATADSQRNANYDRLLIVTNKIIKSQKMTITDKTNLKQLYASWQELGGTDPKVDTMYEECMKLTPILD